MCVFERMGVCTTYLRHKATLWLCCILSETVIEPWALCTRNRSQRTSNYFCCTACDDCQITITLCVLSVIWLFSGWLVMFSGGDETAKLHSFFFLSRLLLIFPSVSHVPSSALHLHPLPISTASSSTSPQTLLYLTMERSTAGPGSELRWGGFLPACQYCTVGAPNQTEISHWSKNTTLKRTSPGSPGRLPSFCSHWSSPTRPINQP